MDATPPKISIVCPVLNEQEVLPHFHRALVLVLERLRDAFDAEIIYADDGSTDDTLLLLRQWAERDPRVRYLSFSRNFGNQAAATAGLEHAWGDAVITMDADLQHPPELIPSLLAKWQEGYDVVVTIRTEEYSPGWLKRYTSDAFFAVLRRVSDAKMQPSACDFRLLSRKAADALLQLRESHRFLRAMVPWLGFRTALVPFTVARRAAGKSKFHFSRLLSLAADALVSSSKLPLRLPLLLSLVVFVLGMGLGGIALLTAWRGRPVIDPYAAFIMVDLHIVGAAVLFGLGTLGEYVGRVFDQVRGRPLYLIKETEKEYILSRTRTPAHQTLAAASGRPSAAA